ncbi:MAG: hypothetical protein U0401_04495 [Anaerolineae bacterium]
MSFKKLILVMALLLTAFVGLMPFGYAQEPTGDELTVQAVIGSAFTYQGRLNSGGAPANGSFDFQFKLFDAAGGGTQIGGVATKAATSVANGLFTVSLDFGWDAFNGQARYLETAVRPAGSGGYTTLSPRQTLTPQPYALHSSSSLALHAPDGSPTNAVYVDNNGNVGVGTTSPSEKLEVKDGHILLGSTTIGSNATTRELVFARNADGGFARIKVENLGTTNGTSYGAGFRFQTNQRR